VVGPFSGVFIDRWDRRRTMITSDIFCRLPSSCTAVLEGDKSRMSTSCWCFDHWEVRFMCRPCRLPYLYWHRSRS
jgi:hypothetical protein